MLDGGRERRRKEIRKKVAFSMTKMQRAAHTTKKSAQGFIFGRLERIPAQVGAPGGQRVNLREVSEGARGYEG